MEQTVLFEEKVYLSPKDMNTMYEEGAVDSVLLQHLKTKLENKCSQHGFVLPDSLEIVSRSMGQLDSGRFTGNIVFHVQATGKVYNPVNGTRVTGKVIKKNKMGLYVIFRDSIRILVARDLHLGNEEFEQVSLDDIIEVEIRKSRFQIRDPFILSIGVFVGKAEKEDEILGATQPTEYVRKERAKVDTEFNAPLGKPKAPAVPLGGEDDVVLSDEEGGGNNNSLPPLKPGTPRPAGAAPAAVAPAVIGAAANEYMESVD